MRGRYLTAVAEARALRAAVTASESEFRRMESLFRDDRNVSEQALKSAEGRYRAEQARQLAAEQSAAAVRDSIRSTWGETVTGWAINPDSRVMQTLLQQRPSWYNWCFLTIFRATRAGKNLGAPGPPGKTRARRDSSPTHRRSMRRCRARAYFYVVDRAAVCEPAARGWRGIGLGARRSPHDRATDRSDLACAARLGINSRMTSDLLRHEVSTGEERNGGWSIRRVLTMATMSRQRRAATAFRGTE